MQVLRLQLVGRGVSNNGGELPASLHFQRLLYVHLWWFSMVGNCVTSSRKLAIVKLHQMQESHGRVSTGPPTRSLDSRYSISKSADLVLVACPAESTAINSSRYDPGIK